LERIVSFKLSSTRLLEKLGEVSSRFSGQSIGAVLKVGSEASWWVFHEFGTAERQSLGGELELPPSVVVNPPAETENGGGYTISGPNGVLLPQTAQYAESTLFHEVEHPGVPPLGLVRSVLPDIHSQAVEVIGLSLQKGEYSPSHVQEAITAEVMPATLKCIVDSIAEKMPKRDDRIDGSLGKLQGATPADVFEGAATIEPLEE
jgi:hypothetical protein